MRNVISMFVVISSLIFMASSIRAEDETLFSEASFSMSQDRLHDLILETGQNIVISKNVVRFNFGEVNLLCISDANADRMRIISPIAKVEELEQQQLVLALMANFHTALDVRYAIREGVIYAAFIHPLSPLTDQQVYSAISQVASANRTFGKEYSSGELVFNN